MNQVEKIKQRILEEIIVSIKELGYYKKSTSDFKGWPIEEHVAMMHLQAKRHPHIIIQVKLVFQVHEWLAMEDPNNPFPKETKEE